MHQHLVSAVVIIWGAVVRPQEAHVDLWVRKALLDMDKMTCAFLIKQAVVPPARHGTFRGRRRDEERGRVQGGGLKGMDRKERNSENTGGGEEDAASGKDSEGQDTVG